MRSRCSPELAGALAQARDHALARAYESSHAPQRQQQHRARSAERGREFWVVLSHSDNRDDPQRGAPERLAQLAAKADREHHERECRERRPAANHRADHEPVEQRARGERCHRVEWSAPAPEHWHGHSSAPQAKPRTRRAGVSVCVTPLVSRIANTLNTQRDQPVSAIDISHAEQ